MSIMKTPKKCVKHIDSSVKVPERPQGPRICFFIINFEHILHIGLVFPLLADTEQVNIDWVKP